MARILKLSLALLLIAGCKKKLSNSGTPSKKAVYYRIIAIKKNGDTVYSNQVVKYVNP